jgi:hypothetical protein
MIQFWFTENLIFPLLQQTPERQAFISTALSHLPTLRPACHYNFAFIVCILSLAEFH